MYLWVGGKWNVRPDESCGVCVCVCVCVVQCDQMQQQPTTPKKSGYKDFRIRKKKERKTDGKSE